MSAEQAAAPPPKRRSRKRAAADEQAVTHIPVADVATGLNNRTVFNPQKLADLAASMAEHGLAQPITVRPRGAGRYQLVAGERRWRAAKLLGWKTIPALVRDLTDRQARSITLIENSHREDVDPIDEALGYRAYMDEFGVGEAEMATAVNLPSVRIYKRLELLKLRADVQEQVRKNPTLLTLFDLMTILDHNRQALALRVLISKSRPPSLAEFRRVVNDFKGDQDKEDGTQGALFTADQIADMWVEKFQVADQAGERARRARLPIDARFPAPRVKDRRQWLANQMKDWADDLAAAGYDEAAAAIYTLTEQCIRDNRLEADESQWTEYFT
ncbi:ParB/RepB/Spo0J family partition protein [Chloroflexales bacterium ZM16-3]|nr:ParB/RepB/Spo0J family partition protein [Chloroflexales bacterium ZM16-3]